ncbi:hypothetical protein ACFXPZ_43675, partial [Streptomyces sp. NPDC059101]|uniref:hypothetical protein n=1 Tax=Streptomyces sp. NPDC059101 TaxID=3346728 RepID=UPI0036D1A657
MRNRRRGVVRLRTLLIWLAVVPTVAMGAQVSFTADRLIQQSANLRADVSDAERIGAPLYDLMTALQAERSAAAARWAGASVSRGPRGGGARRPAPRRAGRAICAPAPPAPPPTG